MQVLERAPEFDTLHIAPPGAPTDVRAAIGAGTARLTWKAPEDDGGAPIVKYTVTSKVLGEDKERRHRPPTTSSASDLVCVSPTRLAIGPYATNKHFDVVAGTGEDEGGGGGSYGGGSYAGSYAGPPPCQVSVRELAEGRTYAFVVTASNGTFESSPSEWSNRVRAPMGGRRIADTRDNLVAVGGMVEQQYLGQRSFQGSYFLEREQPQSWCSEAIDGCCGGDGDRVIAAMMMEGANVNLRIEYDRVDARTGKAIPRSERIFRYGDVEKLTVDGISDIDKVATTGDTLLVLAVKLGVADVIRAVLACRPDLSLRNIKGKSAADAAQREGPAITKLLEAATMPDPDRVARVFGAWQLCEDTTSEGGGPPYYWNTVTNAVQYKPPADPSAAPPDSVHDVLLHSSAWKGW